MSVLVWLLALSAPVIFVWKTWGLLRLDLKVGMNDSTFARDTFIDLLNEAERGIWVCDDGNDFPESIYNDPKVIAAIRRRLELNQALHLYCLFSSTDDTKFVNEFIENPRVHMKRGVLPRRDVHFKIIDDARKGYVSAHPLGCLERRYRSYDCSNVPPHIRTAALGRHLDTMTGFFRVEAAVA